MDVWLFAEAVTGTFHYVTSHVGNKCESSDNEVAADTHGLQRVAAKSCNTPGNENETISNVFVFYEIS